MARNMSESNNPLKALLSCHNFQIHFLGVDEEIHGENKGEKNMGRCNGEKQGIALASEHCEHREH